MADGNKVISKSRSWPFVEVRVNETSFGTQILHATEPEFCQIKYYADKTCEFVLNERPSENRLSFDDIKSIELQSRADYYGQGIYQISELKVDYKQGGKEFCKRVGLDIEQIKTISMHPIAGSLYIAGAGAIVLIAVLIFAVLGFSAIIIATKIGGGYSSAYGFDGYTAGTFTWWRIRGFSKEQVIAIWGGALALKIAITATITVGLFKLLSAAINMQPEIYIYHNNISELYVVMYLTNGKRFILGSSYQNRSLGIEMHTDHVNAWQAAKLSATAKTPAYDHNDYL